MQCKYLESKVYLVPDVVDELGSGFELEYYLLESEGDNFENCESDKVFGFEIIKRSSEGIEKKAIRDFCTSREEAGKILRKLADNAVTPMYLEYVIDDLIGI